MMTNENLKYFLFASIISADNDEFDENVKQEIIKRHKESPTNWEYILGPIGDKSGKLAELFYKLEEYDRKS